MGDDGENEEEPWDPKSEIDPAKIQKEYLEFAKDFVGEMKKQNAERKAAEEEIAASPVGMGAIHAYKPPTFEEVSARVKRCWEETKKIAPDASDFCRSEILRALLHAPSEDVI